MNVYIYVLCSIEYPALSAAVVLHVYTFTVLVSLSKCAHSSRARSRCSATCLHVHSPGLTLQVCSLFTSALLATVCLKLVIAMSIRPGHTLQVFLIQKHVDLTIAALLAALFALR